MNFTNRLISASCMSVAALVAGCGGDAASTSGADASSPSAKVPASSVAGERSSAPAAPSFKTDPEVMKLTKAIAAGCSIGDDGWVRDCKAGEEEALYAYVRKSKTDAYYGSLAELALTEGKTDKKIFSAAAHELGFLPTDVGDDWYKKNSGPEVTRRLLEVVPRVSPASASRVGPGVAAAVLSGGERAAFIEFLDGREERDGIRKSAVSYWLKYGGVDALADLEHFSQSKDSGVRYNAGAAPGVIFPGAWGGAEPAPDFAAKACDIAKKFAASDDADLRSGALDALGRCKGAYIDAALDVIDKRVTESAPPRGLASAAHHLCWSEGITGRAPNGTTAQCTRAVDLLVRLADHAAVTPDELRATLWAVSSIAEKVPELKPKARALKEKFKGNKDKGVADEANKPIK